MNAPSDSSPAPVTRRRWRLAALHWGARPLSVVALAASLAGAPLVGAQSPADTTSNAPTTEPPAPMNVAAPADVAQRLNAAKALVSQGKVTEAREFVKSLRESGDLGALANEVRRVELDAEYGAALHAEFQAALNSLGGDLPTARAAEESLWSNPRLAAAVLGLRLIDEAPGPRLLRGLDLLRRLRSPEVVREVVSRRLDDRAPVDAQAALERLVAAPPGVGLGRLLLDVALSDASDHRARAAWKLLAVVPDPPAEMLSAIALRLDRADAPTAEMLLAAANGARVNRQTDLIGMRNFPELTAEQQAALLALPDKLAQGRDKPAESPEDRALVAAAGDLSSTLGLTTFAPLPNVKIMAAAMGQDFGKPAVLLDGEWGSTEQTKSWRPRHDDPNWLVLDLGAEKVVEGVRLWNHNVRGQAQEAWRDAEIYVGDDPSELRLAGQGVVARAPAKDDAADFGTTIVIAPTRGRFVRLVNRVAWSGGKLAGLSEVQVLGRDP